MEHVRMDHVFTDIDMTDMHIVRDCYGNDVCGQGVQNKCSLTLCSLNKLRPLILHLQPLQNHQCVAHLPCTLKNLSKQARP